MPGTRQSFVDSGCYYLTVKSNRNLNLFDIPLGFEMFRALLAESEKYFPWKLYHYCFVSDQIYLLGHIERGGELPEWLGLILSEYARWFRKHAGYVGRVWQGKYKSVLIETESVFWNYVRLIEHAPVEAGVVTQPGQYRWSSYPFYAFGRLSTFLHLNPYYETMGKNKRQRRFAYRQKVCVEGARHRQRGQAS